MAAISDSQIYNKFFPNEHDFTLTCYIDIIKTNNNVINANTLLRQCHKCDINKTIILDIVVCGGEQMT